MVALPDPAAFRPGVDGIVIGRDGRRGLLLPEVAVMLEPGPTAMLDAVCRKAGLPRDAWRDPRSALWVFRTCRFGGPAT
jgi:AMMECR1 domain-containing protein